MGEAKRRRLALSPWTPFVPAQAIPKTEEEIAGYARDLSTTVEDVKAAFDAVTATDTIYLNSRYQVNVRAFGERGVHLSIKRLDKGPVGVERFRDFQRIKNELVGPECEAVELYPAESRLVDTANQYHLFVSADATFRFPFGFTERAVLGHGQIGAVQQPFEEE